MCILVHSVIRVEAWVHGSPSTPQTLSPRKPWYAAFLSLHSQLADLQRKTRLVLFFLAESGCSESTLVPFCHSHLPWNGQVGSLCTKCLRLFIKCSWKPLHPMSPPSPPWLSLHHLSIWLLARDFLNIYFIVMFFWFWQTKIWPKGKLLNELWVAFPQQLRSYDYVWGLTGFRRSFDGSSCWLCPTYPCSQQSDHSAFRRVSLTFPTSLDILRAYI